MRPADALDRIVYLLDQVLAEGQKVRAFARDVVEATGDDASLTCAAGKLTDLAGIGPTTAKVIAEALDGASPRTWRTWRTRRSSTPATRPDRGPRCGATATARRGRTAGPRSTRWPAPPSPSATSAWS